jgi:hypothetical protein
MRTGFLHDSLSSVVTADLAHARWSALMRGLIWRWFAANGEFGMKHFPNPCATLSSVCNLAMKTCRKG